jgi:hypothetical protein
LSATPNGKHHPDIRKQRSENSVQKTPFRKPRSDIRRHHHQMRQTLFSPEDTSRGIAPRPARTSRRGRAVARDGHTTRFFTICHQPRPAALPTGEPPRAISASCRA